MLSGREATVRIWEATWGREGLWCKACRRATPVEQLLLEESGRALLRCETCAATLRTGPSWLTTLQVPLQPTRLLSTVQS
ncbi:MAG: hypothetical protein ABR549_03965 [Mycobacteriales bacterium]